MAAAAMSPAMTALKVVAEALVVNPAMPARKAVPMAARMVDPTATTAPPAQSAANARIAVHAASARTVRTTP